jgi:hypothetical protein
MLLSSLKQLKTLMHKAESKAAKRAVKRRRGTKEATVITVTPRGTVVAFGCLQRCWRGMKFERRSRVSRTARAMIADAKAKERASREQNHRGS